MEKIASFTVNHEDLEPGVYVSRKDRIGAECVTTFDIRVTQPNDEPVMGTAEVHTIEHLGATFLRNDPEWRDRTVYFGPMGCRTGFYVIFAGDLQSADVIDVVTRMFEFVRDFEGDIPGAAPHDCGNWRDQNLDFAHWYARRFLDKTLYCIDEAHMNYPA